MPDQTERLERLIAWRTISIGLLTSTIGMFVAAALLMLPLAFLFALIWVACIISAVFLLIEKLVIGWRTIYGKRISLFGLLGLMSLVAICAAVWRHSAGAAVATLVVGVITFTIFIEGESLRISLLKEMKEQETQESDETK